MSTQTIRLLIFGALLVHGIGHTLGFWRPARSWLMPGVSESTLRMVGGILWVLVAIGFILAALGYYHLLVPLAWWRPLALYSAILSLVGLLLFFGTWPVFNFIGATAMNIAVLVALLWKDSVLAKLIDL
jgi:hypothetical protein